LDIILKTAWYATWYFKNWYFGTFLFSKLVLLAAFVFQAVFKMMSQKKKKYNMNLQNGKNELLKSRI